MAWIESHQRLKGDPKLKRFCRRLDIARPTGIGMLHELWWWSLEHAENGDLSRIDPRDIATEIDWPEQRADELWQALIEKGPPTNEYPDGEPGFVDPNGWIHGWMRFAGRLIRDRERKRVKRAGSDDDGGQLRLDPTRVQGPSADSPGNSTLDRTLPYPTRPTDNGAAKPPRFGPSNLVSLWNELAVSPLAKVVKLTPERERHARARLAEEPSEKFWRGVIERISRSLFCRGGNQRGWVADFDFLIKPGKAINVIEGKYDEHGAAPVNGQRANPAYGKFCDWQTADETCTKHRAENSKFCADHSRKANELAGSRGGGFKNLAGQAPGADAGDPGRRA